MTRILTWIAFLGVVYLGYHLWSEWRSPWKLPAVSPITSVMPALPDGCRSKPECL